MSEIQVPVGMAGRVSARVIRKDGTVEDLGVIAQSDNWDDEKPVDQEETK